MSQREIGATEIERVSALVHDSWMEEQRKRGRTSSVGRDGEEYMVPYSELSEAGKELDRVTVRAVLKHAQAAATELRAEVERLAADWIREAAEIRERNYFLDSISLTQEKTIRTCAADLCMALAATEVQ